jgi:hypothetical protein
MTALISMRFLYVISSIGSSHGYNFACTKMKELNEANEGKDNKRIISLNLFRMEYGYTK